MNEELGKLIMDREIVEAFRQMDPRKAPSLDGMSGSFYKNHWNIVGQDTINFCKGVFNGRRSVADVNNMMLVLKPKVNVLEDMSYFRPISLCQVIYKIYSKVLANRIKLLLSNCISINQSAFSKAE